MRTLNEIKASYRHLLADIDSELPRIAENQAALLELEESVYNEKTHHESDKYLSYLQLLMSHAMIVKLMRSYAESLSDLRNEVDQKVAFLRGFGARYLNSESILLSLTKIAIECESIAGQLYTLGGELDEKMLYLTRLYLNDKVVHEAFHHMAENHQEAFNFCIPWIKYHRNEERDPRVFAKLCHPH